MIIFQKKRVLRLLPLFLLILLFSCRTGSPSGEGLSLIPPAQDAIWVSSEYPGLKFLKAMDDSLPVGGAAAALDVGSIRVILTGADKSGRGETRSALTSDFVRKQNVQLAVNGSPFSRVDILNRSGRPMDIIGVQINEGVSVSPPVKSLDALYILKDGSIEMGSQSRIPEKTRSALGGFHLLLRNGVILGEKDGRNPRTAVGISSDGKTLYLAVFDGRQKNRAGLTTEEAALWMKWLGSSTALNLDGGGSTVMVLKDTKGFVHVLNSPVHRGRPGLERVVANHLGIRLKTP